MFFFVAVVTPVMYLLFSRLLCAFRGQYFSAEVHHQHHSDVESVASVDETEDTDDTLDRLVENDTVSGYEKNASLDLVDGESSIDDVSYRPSSSSAVPEASEVARVSVNDTDASEQEDSAEGGEVADNDINFDYYSRSSVSTSLFSSQAICDLDTSVLPSAMPAGGFGRCFIEV